MLLIRSTASIKSQRKHVADHDDTGESFDSSLIDPQLLLTVLEMQSAGGKVNDIISGEHDDPEDAPEILECTIDQVLRSEGSQQQSKFDLDGLGFIARFAHINVIINKC